MHKYSVIINSIPYDRNPVIINTHSYERIVKEINKLETQKYKPDKYIIICNNLTSSYLVTYLKAASIKWVIKVPADEEKDVYAIDECFRTNTFQSRFCLYFNTDKVYSISPKLSEYIESKINPDYWYYNFSDIIFFPTILCKYFTFSNIQSGLIEAGYSDKIYIDEHPDIG